jgi:hypothetical protein
VAEQAVDNRPTQVRSLTGLPNTMEIIMVSTCIFCAYGAAIFKLRRRWVHHFPDTGKLIACEARNLKPQS